MNDPDIIKLYYQRSEEAIRASREKYGAYLRTIARGILCDERDVEEVLNDVGLEAWNSIPPGSPEDLGAFLSRLCRNRSIDLIRKQRRQKRGGGEYEAVLDEAVGIADTSASPEREAENGAVTELLDRFLHGLPKKKRRIFVQRYWYLLPLKSIAEDNGMTESAVKMQLSRMRSELKELLIKEEHNCE